MPVSASQQSAVFLVCIISGILSGILYDLISAIRHGFKLTGVAAFLSDICFWLISAVIFFSGLQLTCGGDVKWFAPVGAILGLILYMIGISRFFLPFFEKSVLAVKTVFFNVFKWIFRPLLAIFGKIFKKYRNFVKNAQKKRQIFVKKVIEKIRRFIILLKMY